MKSQPQTNVGPLLTNLNEEDDEDVIQPQPSTALKIDGTTLTQECVCDPHNSSSPPEDDATRVTRD